MAKKRSKVVKPQEEVVARYSVSLELDGKMYKGEGASVYEALKNVERPAKLMGKAVISVTDGTKKGEQVLWPKRLKMFFRPIAQVFQAKNLAATMK